MATNAANECGVCHEEFDEATRCPRIFKCFHSFCTSCIDRLIKTNSKQCPFCRLPFDAKRATDVNLNLTALQFMKSIAFQESSYYKTAMKNKDTPLKERLNRLKRDTRETSSRHLVHCQEIQNQTEKTLEEVMNIKKIITQETTRIENDILPKMNEVISENEKRVEELNMLDKSLKNQLNKIKEKNEQLKNVQAKLDSCVADTYKETAVVLDEAEETNSAIDKWMENFKDLVSAGETLQITEKETKNTKEKMNTVAEVLSQREERNEETTVGLLPVLTVMAYGARGALFRFKDTLSTYRLYLILFVLYVLLSIFVNGPVAIAVIMVCISLKYMNRI